MKKNLMILLCVVFAVFAVSDGFAKTKWDMHLNYPAGNFHSQGAQRFADRVAEATGGELTIVLHPGAALGFKGPELLRAVAEGQLAVAEVPTGMVEGDAPVLALTATATDPAGNTSEFSEVREPNEPPVAVPDDMAMAAPARYRAHCWRLPPPPWPFSFRSCFFRTWKGNCSPTWR